MSIHPKILENLSRFGISLPDDQKGTVIEILNNLVIEQPRLSDKELLAGLESKGIPATPKQLESSSAREALESIVAPRKTPRPTYTTSADRRRDLLVAGGLAEAANWDEDDLLEHSFRDGHRYSVGLSIGNMAPLDFYTGVNPEVSTWWAEDSSHIYFLEVNADDPTDPYVTSLDSEDMESAPYDNVRMSKFLADLVKNP